MTAITHLPLIASTSFGPLTTHAGLAPGVSSAGAFAATPPPIFESSAGAVGHSLFPPKTLEVFSYPPALASLALLVRPQDKSGALQEPVVSINLLQHNLNVDVSFASDASGERVPVILDQDELLYDADKKEVYANDRLFSATFEKSGVPILLAHADGKEATQELENIKNKLKSDVNKLFDMNGMTPAWHLNGEKISSGSPVLWQGLTLRDGTEISLAVCCNRDGEWELVQQNPHGSRYGAKEIGMAIKANGANEALVGFAQCAIKPGPQKGPLEDIAEYVDMVEFAVLEGQPVVFYFRRDIGIFIPANSNLKYFAGDKHQYANKTGVNSGGTGSRNPELEKILVGHLNAKQIQDLLVSDNVELDPITLQVTLSTLNTSLVRNPNDFSVPSVREIYIKLKAASLGMRSKADRERLIDAQGLKHLSDFKSVATRLSMGVHGTANLKSETKKTEKNDETSESSVTAVSAGAGTGTGAGSGGGQYSQQQSEDNATPAVTTIEKPATASPQVSSPPVIEETPAAPVAAQEVVPTPVETVPAVSKAPIAESVEAPVSANVEIEPPIENVTVHTDVIEETVGAGIGDFFADFLPEEPVAPVAQVAEGTAVQAKSGEGKTEIDPLLSGSLNS